jgi:3-oxoadipate enol-lactonase
MYVRSQDAQIYYESRGEGPPVVLLHPFPVHHAIWEPIATQLEHRYRVILPDLRGLGHSAVGDGPATMEKHSADLLAVLRDADVERAVFAGVSIGGYILFDFWRRHRARFDALVLCCTRAAADSEAAKQNRLRAIDHVQQHGVSRYLDTSAPNLFSPTTRSNRPDLVASARAMMESASVEGIVALQQGMMERPDSLETLKTIDVPTLVIAGRDDSLIPLDEAETMHRMIRGSEMVRIPDAGHYAIWEQLESVGRALRQFLDRIR